MPEFEHDKNVIAAMTLTLFDDWSFRIEASEGNKIVHLGMLKMAELTIASAPEKTDTEPQEKPMTFMVS